MAAAEAITAALLAGVAGGRVYPKYRPQHGALPALVWNTIGVYPQGRVSASAGPGLWSARIQIDCIDSSYAGMKNLVEAVRAAVHLKSGTFGGKTLVASMIDHYAADDVNQDTQIYAQPVDIMLEFYD